MFTDHQDDSQMREMEDIRRFQYSVVWGDGKVPDRTLFLTLPMPF